MSPRNFAIMSSLVCVFSWGSSETFAQQLAPTCYYKGKYQLKGCHCDPDVDNVCDGHTPNCVANLSIARRPPNCLQQSCDDAACKVFYGSQRRQIQTN
jgi:hypothetical protein